MKNRSNIRSGSERSGKLARRIFVDTNPLIYLVGEKESYFNKVLRYFESAIKDDAEFFTSTITDAEFLAKPVSENDKTQIEKYRTYLFRLGFQTRNITSEIAERSAHIRARYKGIKLADALQLAASIDCSCDAFLTNDAQLKQVAEANVVHLGNL